MKEKNKKHKYSFRLDDIENHIFQSRFDISYSNNYSDFIRKCVLNDKIFVCNDLDSFSNMLDEILEMKKILIKIRRRYKDEVFIDDKLALENIKKINGTLSTLEKFYTYSRAIYEKLK